MIRNGPVTGGWARDEPNPKIGFWCVCLFPNLVVPTFSQTAVNHYLFHCYISDPYMCSDKDIRCAQNQCAYKKCKKSSQAYLVAPLPNIPRSLHVMSWSTFPIMKMSPLFQQEFHCQDEIIIWPIGITSLLIIPHHSWPLIGYMDP